MKPAAEMDRHFLVSLLTSPSIYAQASQSLTGAAQPTIGLRQLRQFIAPLPPIAEQRRIVARINELMCLCDRLEESLKASNETRHRLLDALIAEALASAQVA